MSLPDPSGFAVRRNGSCLAEEVDCGRTQAPFRACCPARASCPQQYNVDCCPSPANCTATLLQDPTCANSTWSLYDNHGYFCCPPGTIGYNASRTFSDGCANPGSPPRGASLLAVVSAGQSKSSPLMINKYAAGKTKQPPSVLLSCRFLDRSQHPHCIRRNISRLRRFFQQRLSFQHRSDSRRGHWGNRRHRHRSHHRILVLSEKKEYDTEHERPIRTPPKELP